jgi:transposase
VTKSRKSTPEPGITLSDAAWQTIQPLLPTPAPKKQKGRPRMDDRQAMLAIWYKLRTGCSWKHLPRSLGAGSTIHDRYLEWQQAGFFDRLKQAGILKPEQESVTE